VISKSSELGGITLGLIGAGVKGVGKTTHGATDGGGSVSLTLVRGSGKGGQTSKICELSFAFSEGKEWVVDWLSTVTLGAETMGGCVKPAINHR